MVRVWEVQIFYSSDKKSMNPKNTLLILSRDARRYAELIKQLDIAELEFTACENTEEARKYIEQCNIMLGEPARIAPLLNTARQIQWVQSTFAGVEALLHHPCRSDYILTGVKEVFGLFISEYVFAYILALERHLFEVYTHQQHKRWHKIPYTSLQGKLIGICGLGSIGRHLARTAKHFGMSVWGYKRSYESFPDVDRVFTNADFQEFLAQPEYIVITLPHTPKTEHLFNAEAFRAMKSSAILINVGRGKVVLESALVQALQEYHIRGAVLDVFEEEPLSKESPLWTLSNVFITPHNSAYSFPKMIVNIFAENYRRFVVQEPLQYLVDFHKGY